LSLSQDSGGGVTGTAETPVIFRLEGVKKHFGG
jgi:hypothetical protein